MLFLGIAKQLSPEIDVGIGDDENSTSTEEIADADKTSVDDRLRLLQQEDEGKKVQDNTFATELDEKVVLPDQKKMTTLILQLKKRLHFLTKAQIQDL